MYDMTIHLQTDSEKCLYEQIYEYIRQEIREGRLLTGERLPSTRSLAEYLQVARSTVVYAYDQLLSEGYIEARPYRGYFVCPAENLFQMSEQADSVNFAGAQNSGAQREERPEPVNIAPPDYDFSLSGIDMSGFPFGVWKRITQAILNDGNSELFSRGESQGDYDLRVTINRYLHSSRGVQCTPEQIVVGAGNDYLFLLLSKILGREVRVAMENATYMRAYHIFQSFSYDMFTVETDRYGMTAAGLSAQEVQAAYVMPSHQFPLGTVMPVGRRMELLRWADGSADRYLIEDDYDSEFRYRGKPIPALQSLDRHGKVIYMGTFSKAIAPAIRVGYMVLPRELLERYRKECCFYACTVSRIDQSILNRFIRDGYFERHLNKMRKIYRTKHDVLLESLKPFETCFRISGADAGLHLLLTAREKAKERELIEKASQEGVRVYGLSENTVHGAEGQATILLGFGGMTLQQIREGTQRLQKAWLS